MKYFHHIDNRDTRAPLKREGGVSMGVSCFLDSLKISNFQGKSESLFLPLLLLKDSSVP